MFGGDGKEGNLVKRCQTHQENLLVGEKRKVTLSVADADPGP
jgi:hypothetical protein